MGYEGPILVVRADEWEGLSRALKLIPDVTTADLKRRVDVCIEQRDRARIEEVTRRHKI